MRMAERTELPPDGSGQPGFQAWLPVALVERLLAPTGSARPAMRAIDLTDEDGARIGTLGVGLATVVGDRALGVVRWDPRLTDRAGAERALDRLLGTAG
jgi:hypothetical protein